MAFPWAALVSGGLGFLGDMFSANAKRKLQEETWAREDNAVQRRVADLEAAGLNPILAAGQPAQTMAPIQTENVGTAIKSAADRGLAAMQVKEQIENTKAQRSLLDAQADKARAEAYVLETTASDKIRISALRADLEETVQPAKIALAYGQMTSKELDNKMGHLMLEIQGLYGTKKAEAEALIASLTYKIQQETRLDYEKAKAAAMDAAADFMRKNVNWYEVNHLLGPALQGASKIAPYLTLPY